MMFVMSGYLLNGMEPFTLKALCLDYVFRWGEVVQNGSVVEIFNIPGSSWRRLNPQLP